MTDQCNDNNQVCDGNSETSLTNFLSGGLPQLLAGPAGKAISRLVGAGVDIPVAWLESFAQDIRDKTEARSIVTKAIAEQAAEMAVEHPEVMYRAMNSLISSTYRKQNNKEAVAAVTIEELKDKPPSSESTGPSEDWMNRFERYAEDASSEDLRIMFGKILAGEIRKPGAVSPATLRFVSELSSDTAKLIERVLPYTSIEGQTFLECMKEPLSIQEESELERLGFWTLNKTVTFSFDPPTLLGKHRINEFDSFFLTGKSGESISFITAMLSQMGIDLVSIINSKFDIQAIANKALRKTGVMQFFCGQIENADKEHKKIDNLVEFHQSDV